MQLRHRPRFEPPWPPRILPTMRVLHVIPGLDRKSGGPAIALHGLASAQHAAGLQVSVLSAYRKGDDLSFVDALKSENIAVRLAGPVRGKLGRYAGLFHAADECVATADIVHIHAMWEEIVHQTARSAQRRGT